MLPILSKFRRSFSNIVILSEQGLKLKRKVQILEKRLKSMNKRLNNKTTTLIDA